MKLKLLICLFAVCTFTSCINYNDVQFKEVKNIEVRNSGSQNMLIDVAVDVENKARGFIIKEASVEAVKGDNILAAISITDKVKIKKGDNNDLIIPVRVNIRGGLLGAAAFALSVNSLRYNVSVELKSFIITKNYQYKNLTAEQVEKIIGIDIKNLIKR